MDKEDPLTVKVVTEYTTERRDDGSGHRVQLSFLKYW